MLCKFFDIFLVVVVVVFMQISKDYYAFAALLCQINFLSSGRATSPTHLSLRCACACVSSYLCEKRLTN